MTQLVRPLSCTNERSVARSRSVFQPSVFVESIHLEQELVTNCQNMTTMKLRYITSSSWWCVDEMYNFNYARTGNKYRKHLSATFKACVATAVTVIIIIT